MADEPLDDDGTLELTDMVDDDDPGDAQPDDDTTDTDDEADDDVITFGDEELPAAAQPDAETNLAKHLRDEIRRRDKELAELRRAVPAEQPIEVGEKPTLEACEFDEDKFADEFEAWQDRKAKAARQADEREHRAAKQSEEFNAELARYEEGKAALRFADKDEAEAIVTSALDQLQQSILVMAADQPALVLYALGKHPAKLAEIAKITNPVKLSAAIVKFEGGLKVAKSRKAPAPDQVERGSAGVAAGSDKQLARLEREAERTGNRTALLDYKRKLKAN